MNCKRLDPGRIQFLSELGTNNWFVLLDSDWMHWSWGPFRFFFYKHNPWKMLVLEISNSTSEAELV